MRSNNILRKDFFNGKHIKYIVFDGIVFEIRAEGISYDWESIIYDCHRTMSLIPIGTDWSTVSIYYHYRCGCVFITGGDIRVQNILDVSKRNKHKIRTTMLHSAIRRIYA